MDIPLLFRCDECGYKLEAEFVQDYRGRNIVHVKPCQYCIDEAVYEVKKDIKQHFNGCLDRRED